ncbi:amidase [Roseibium denhamense]|uniref:Amidase n=1 Tax=Roseibium denhamense TaxID=76305 RepID=A0ABY1PHV0_9HYPH|nr:amidase [Roseibium denhamense]SMP32942.1 amidase [Roseibium denhamense]
MEPLWSRTAVELAEQIRTGQTTAVAVVEACLERIRSLEPVINAWEYLDPEAALAQARQCDQSAPAGPLHGVPVAVKDIFDTFDMPTAYGSSIYAGHRPQTDAESVARLRAAGAVILGKTVTTEFATFCPGKTSNPHNPAHTPGGSSSGSAAAVAARMVPLAYGSQTVGSVVRPASFNGVTGLKADYGRFSLNGVKPLAPALDTLGFFARRVDDIALILNALEGKTAASPEPKGLPNPKVAVIRTAHWETADLASKRALEATMDRLSNAGAVVSEPDLPPDFADLADVQNTFFTAGAAHSLKTEWQDHRDELSPQLQTVILEGLQQNKADLAAAEEVAARCRRHMDTLFGGTDFIIAPAAVGEAPEGLEKTGDPLFSRMWTVLHGPCISLPGFKGDTGLPVGVQLIGKRGGDETLLRWARWVENLLPEPDWPD